MIVNCQNFTHALTPIDGIQYVNELLGLARLEINFKDPVIYAEPIRRSRGKPVVLEQGVLHEAEKESAVRADCQALHAAICLASRCIAEQLGIRVGAWVGDGKLGWYGKATHLATLPVELINIRAIFV